MTGNDLTTETVMALRAEAGQAGDVRMVALCDIWLTERRSMVPAFVTVAIVDALNDAEAQR